jgi:hypothetical protein
MWIEFPGNSRPGIIFKDILPQEGLLVDMKKDSLQ